MDLTPSCETQHPAGPWQNHPMRQGEVRSSIQQRVTGFVLNFSLAEWGARGGGGGGI